VTAIRFPSFSAPRAETKKKKLAPIDAMARDIKLYTNWYPCSGLIYRPPNIFAASLRRFSDYAAVGHFIVEPQQSGEAAA
jgi:hypothetical protein